jgi:hypothetical protein
MHDGNELYPLKVFRPYKGQVILSFPLTTTTSRELVRWLTFFSIPRSNFLSFVQATTFTASAIASSNMFNLTFLSSLLALGASALPTITMSQRDYSTNSDLVERDNWSVTRNDLVNGGCSPVTIIFARGTLELGNVGSLAGPPFFNALTNMIGDSNVAVQGVDYAASIIGYLEGGDPAGASTMASLINQAVSQCPSTQIVISGYRYACPYPH